MLPPTPPPKKRRKTRLGGLRLAGSRRPCWRSTKEHAQGLWRGHGNSHLRDLRDLGKKGGIGASDVTPVGHQKKHASKKWSALLRRTALVWWPISGERARWTDPRRINLRCFEFQSEYFYIYIYLYLFTYIFTYIYIYIYIYIYMCLNSLPDVLFSFFFAQLLHQSPHPTGRPSPPVTASRSNDLSRPWWPVVPYSPSTRRNTQSPRPKGVSWANHGKMVV